MTPLRPQGFRCALVKVKPLFSYSAGLLVDAEGKAVVARPAQLRIGDFAAGLAEADLNALAASGASLVLLRLSLGAIATSPDAFNEAALARLREILKKMEEKRVAAVICLESPAAQDELFAGAAEHAARRLKDCASLLGFAAPQCAGDAFLLSLAARLEKKHPTLLIFIPPCSKDGAEQAQGSESLRRPPFVAPEFWPEGWL